MQQFGKTPVISCSSALIHILTDLISNTKDYNNFDMMKLDSFDLDPI